METDLKILNEQYSIPGQLSFQAGPGGLAMAVVQNAFAEGAMTLAGGHVMRYVPTGQQPVLWLSPNASFTIGKAMRGGVPVCWPWFGLHPTDPLERPLHGLVRTMLWSVVGSSALSDGSTEVRMRVSDTPQTLELWPHPFELELVASFGARLKIEWLARNPGSAPYHYTGALHPYYSVSDVHAITIYGLDGVDYLDKTEQNQPHQQEGPLQISGLTDNIYLNTTAAVTIVDPGLKRAIQITKSGSHTTVVWNPDHLDAEMPDVGPGQHRHFVCAEAANAVDDVVSVSPGGEGHLQMEIWAEPREDL